jgi:hypothetical protein
MASENNLAKCACLGYSVLSKKREDIIEKSLESSRILKFATERVRCVARTFRHHEDDILPAFGDLLWEFVALENGIDVVPPSMKMHNHIHGIGLTEPLWNEDSDTAVAIMLVRRELLISVHVPGGAMRMRKWGRGELSEEKLAVFGILLVRILGEHYS